MRKFFRGSFFKKKYKKFLGKYFEGRNQKVHYVALKYTTIKAYNFIEKKLWHRCFPMNIRKFLRTPILQKICERLFEHSPFPTCSNSITSYIESEEDVFSKTNKNKNKKQKSQSKTQLGGVCHA